MYVVHEYVSCHGVGWAGMGWDEMCVWFFFWRGRLCFQLPLGVFAQSRLRETGGIYCCARWLAAPARPSRLCQLRAYGFRSQVMWDVTCGWREDEVFGRVLVWYERQNELSLCDGIPVGVRRSTINFYVGSHSRASTRKTLESRVRQDGLVTSSA